VDVARQSIPADKPVMPISPIGLGLVAAQPEPEATPRSSQPVSRKKKTSTIQKAAAIATIGLPAPVRKVATSKLGSFLLIVGGVVLAATGAITLSWQNGIPTVTVNEPRAKELRQDVEARAEIVAERIVEEQQRRASRY
jgi:hypothetical protein